MKSKTSGNNNKFSTISHQLDERFNMDGFDLQAEESKTAVEETTQQQQQQQRKLKPLSREKLEAFKERHDNTGVVYMSRVPPAMKPQKVRHLLSQFGEIGRIYLAAEDPKIRERRKRSGGNKKKCFQEGWIEFMDKRVAKTVAATLNNQIMGGKKSNYYHDDIWNLKYLSKFKWIHLNEQLAYERQERQKKLQMETEQAKKEIGAYLRNVDQSKMLQAMEQKRKRKAIGDSNGGSSEQNASNGTTDEAALQAFRRRFKQRKVVDDTETGGLATNGLSNSLLNQLLT